MKTGQTAPAAHELHFDARLGGRDFRFATTWGLFHPKGIDAGTALLLQQLEVEPEATCLDLGCGWGPIGLTLAHLAPAGHVHMVDKDFVAIEYAQKNADVNGCANTSIYLSNGFSHVPADVHFDLVVSNIPAKVGGELLQFWMTQTHRRLHPGGALWVVTVAGLKDYIKRVFREEFGNYRKVKQNRTHIVAVAERMADPS